MWYQIFLWALFSSVFVHTIAGAICFATLRQHKYGKYVSNVLTAIYNTVQSVYDIMYPQILSAAHYNNGCIVTTDIRSCQFSSSCFCV
jgi:hypothetical protein